MSEYCKGGSADDTSPLLVVAGGKRVGIVDSPTITPQNLGESRIDLGVLGCRLSFSIIRVKSFFFFYHTFFL